MTEDKLNHLNDLSKEIHELSQILNEWNNSACMRMTVGSQELCLTTQNGAITRPNYRYSPLYDAIRDCIEQRLQTIKKEFAES